MWNKTDKSGDPCLIPDLSRKALFFMVKYYSSCGLVICSLYYLGTFISMFVLLSVFIM